MYTCMIGNKMSFLGWFGYLVAAIAREPKDFYFPAFPHIGDLQDIYIV